MDTHWLGVNADTLVDKFGRTLEGEGYGMVLYRHWFVRDLEDEFYEASNAARYRESGIHHQIDLYYQRFAGLLRKGEHFTNTIFALNTDAAPQGHIANLMNEWWWHNYLYSFEDQMSLPILLQLHHVKVLAIGDGKHSPCMLLGNFESCGKTKGILASSV